MQHIKSGNEIINVPLDLCYGPTGKTNYGTRVSRKKDRLQRNGTYGMLIVAHDCMTVVSATEFRDEQMRR